MSKSSGFSYGWVVVGAGALMTCVGFGVDAVAGGVPAADFARRWAGRAAASRRRRRSTSSRWDWRRSSGARCPTGSAPASSCCPARCCSAPGWSAASQATSLWQFQLTFGVLIGVAAGSFYAPMMAAASAWIEHHRSLAVALVSAGMGVAPLTVAPFASWLITTYDWRTAMLVIGIVAWALLIPASFLVRPAPQPAGACGRKWNRRA